MKKIRLSLALTVAFLASVNLLAQQVLPTSGGFYQIKNASTGTTYLGGSGSGSGAVKHEDAATNSTYHIFLIAGDNTAGWTLKQVRSGLYLTHDNEWTGSYAAATGTNRQLFMFDNTTSNDYIVIKKKADNGSFNMGIGFDDVNPGVTVYMDKGTDKNNRWLFEAVSEADALAARLAEMDALAATAQSAKEATGNPGYINEAELTAAIAATESVNDFTGADAAITLLGTAIANYNAIITAYKPLKDELNAVATLIEASDYPGKDAFEAAIEAAHAVYNNEADQTTAISSAVGALKDAKRTYILSIITGLGTFDVTPLLTNWGFDSNCNFKAADAIINLGSADQGANIKVIEGWTINNIGDNSAAATYEFGYAGTLNGQNIPAFGFEVSVGALGISAAWSAMVTYKQDVKLPAGKYSLVYAAWNQGPYATDNSKTGWVPATGTAVLSNRTSFPIGTWVSDTIVFTLTDETVGAIQVGISAPNAGSNGVGRIFFDHVKLYYTTEVIKDALQAAVTKAEAALGDASRDGSEAFAATIDAAKALLSDETVTQAEVNEATAELIEKTELFYMYSVTEENPMEFTGWIVNPTFTDGNSGWTTTTGARNNGIATNQQGDFTGPFWENWNPSAYTGKMYQTINNVPKGKYKLKMAVFTSTQKVPYSDWMYLYANKGKTPITTTTPTYYEVFGLVADGKLEIGIEMTEPISQWVGIDNASLTYYGFNLDDFKVGLQTRVDDAKTTFNTPIEKTVRAVLDAALAKAEAVLADNDATLDAIDEATDTLLIATTSAAASKALYTTLAVALADADTLIAHNPDLSGKAALQATIAAINTSYTAGEYDAAGIKQALADLRLATNRFRFTAATSEPFDATFVLINPSFETGNIEGWTATANTGDMGAKLVSNDTYKMEPADGNYVFNIWAGSSMNFFVEQQVDGLPDGLYTLTALIASDSNNSISLYIDGAEKAFTLSTPKETAVEVSLANIRIKNGTAKLGAKSTTWFKADHFRLTYQQFAEMAVVNPDINAANNNVVPEGWTIDKGAGNSYTNVGQHYSGDGSNRYLDSWNGTPGAMIYTATQVLEKVPNGVYLFKAVARSSGEGAYVFANEMELEIPNNGDQNGNLGRGWNKLVIDSVIVMDSTLRIGAKTTPGWTGTWFSADEFSVSFIGEGDSATYRHFLHTRIDEIEAFMAKTANGEEAEMRAIMAQVDEAEDMFAYYSELKAAYEAFKPKAAPFVELLTAYDKARTLYNTTSYPGKTAFGTALDSIEYVINADNTTNEDVPAAIEYLTNATFAYNVSQKAPADLTFVIVNPGFEEGQGGTLLPGSSSAGNLNLPKGWNITRLAAGGNSVLYTNGSFEGKYAYEMWYNAGQVDAFGVDQSITAPKTGFYVLSARFRSDQNTSKTGAFNDAHVFAKVGNDSIVSGLLGQAPGFVYGDGWNSVDAWIKLEVAFKADSGEVVKLGAAATCFLQMDDFKLIFKGDNDPSKIDVAYVTRQKAMSGTGADQSNNDAIYRMLNADTNMKVTLVEVSDASATATLDLGNYDVLIVQESFGGGDGILTPSGALGLSKLTVPTLYNKTYAFRNGRALVNGGSATGGEVEGVYTITVDPANQANDLFKGLTFVDDKVALFTVGADDNGGDSRTKALNYATGVVGAEKSLLAYPSVETVPSLSFNDIQAGDTIGGEVINTRIITFGMNFGAICRDGGANITLANYTLWRNAVYVLGGMAVPTTAPELPDAVKEVAAKVFDIYPNPTSDRLNIQGLDGASTVRIYTLTGKQLFMDKVEQGSTSIDMTGFDKGIYMLQIESNGKSINTKIVKN